MFNKYIREQLSRNRKKINVEDDVCNLHILVNTTLLYGHMLDYIRLVKYRH
jgi:hypothetical protein